MNGSPFSSEEPGSCFSFQQINFFNTPVNRYILRAHVFGILIRPVPYHYPFNRGSSPPQVN